MHLTFLFPSGIGCLCKGGNVVVYLENLPIFRKDDEFSNNKAKLPITVKHIQRNKSNFKENERVHTITEYIKC